MYKKTILIFIVCLFAIRLEAEETVLTLERAVEEVLAHNADVKASYYKTEAARARIPQAKSLENPMVGVMFDDVPRDTLRVKSAEEIDYRIEQKIPFPGKRYVRGKEARFEAEATTALSEGHIQTILLDLKETYYEAWRLDRSLEINRNIQKLLHQISGSTEIAYATGQTTADVPIKVQLEENKLKNEEVLLERDHTTHLSHLRALLNRENHQGILFPQKLVWPRLNKSLEDLLFLALEERPELKAMLAMEKRDRSKLTSAKQSLIPDFSLAFQYGQRPTGKDTWTSSAMVNLPIFFWGKNKAQIQEAKASLKATMSERSSMKIHLQHDIQQAYSAVKASEQIVASYQQNILPKVKANLETTQLAYRTKKVDFLTVIDAFRNYKEMQMSYYENQALLGKSFAQLERLVGRDL